ncbi:uncharacterized protein PV07_06093 [Cladophialophora immunda]|uniref:Uncharacterized protein n=1 Tax=Cladophialophora immunda TaxID=569365 RepID=A0A0D2CGT0_9EURO|nr:uncharacterized protein PV07_06093 [Cladophialophora immunda]KIW30343.1 hypothetical protein PV07_06093 [Cladophialophora immunda]
MSITPKALAARCNFVNRDQQTQTFPALEPSFFLGTVSAPPGAAIFDASAPITWRGADWGPLANGGRLGHDDNQTTFQQRQLSKPCDPDDPSFYHDVAPSNILLITGDCGKAPP